jgi:hypothetical protein
MLRPGNASKNMDARPRDAASAPDELAGSAATIFTAGPTQPRFQTKWGRTIFLVIVLAAAASGLARLSFHVTDQAQEPDPADSSSGGIIDRSELLHLWLPRSLAELAKCQSRVPVVRTHEELQRFLDLQNGKDVWYAMTTRGYQVNGKMVDITFLRWPYEDSSHFPEVLDVLATAAGNPPRDADVDQSKAPIHIIGQELLKRDPRKVMAELISDPSTTLDAERGP